MHSPLDHTEVATAQGTCSVWLTSVLQMFCWFALFCMVDILAGVLQVLCLACFVWLTILSVWQVFDRFVFDMCCMFIVQTTSHPSP